MTKKYAGQEWAQHDVNVVAVFVLLLFLGIRWPVCFVLALGYAALLATIALVRYLRRRRRWARQEPQESWTDRLR